MQSCIVILYIIATKTKYRTGPNAAPDNNNPAAKPKFLKCAEKRQKHSSH